MNDKYKDISSTFLLGHCRFGKASGQGLSQVHNYHASLRWLSGRRQRFQIVCLLPFLKAESLLRTTHVSNLKQTAVAGDGQPLPPGLVGKCAESVRVVNLISLDSFSLMRQYNTTSTQPVFWILFYIHLLLWSNLFLSFLLVEAKSLQLFFFQTRIFGVRVWQLRSLVRELYFTACGLWSNRFK